MSLRHVAVLGSPRLTLATLRAKLASRRNRFYLKYEKLWESLSAGSTKEDLCSGMPEWADEIKRGFQYSPHQVDFGTITEESFRRYDIVVPLGLTALRDARRRSPLQNSALPLPSEESVRLCDDKFEFNQALVRLGFGRYIPKMVQGMALTPPYILKRRVGAWGKDCYIIRNCEDEEAQLNRITDPDYFCQELVSGSSEFATHILFAGGRIIKALNIKYGFGCDTPIKGQSAEHFRVVHRCRYLKLFARILLAIQFEGICCVNYKVAKGQPFLLEINPRFGGSLAPYVFSFIRYFG